MLRKFIEITCGREQYYFRVGMDSYINVPIVSFAEVRTAFSGIGLWFEPELRYDIDEAYIVSQLMSEKMLLEKINQENLICKGCIFYYVKELKCMFYINDHPSEALVNADKRRRVV